MILTFFIYLLAFKYLFSGLICWLVIVKDINTSYSLPWWQNLLMIFASVIVIIVWPIWLIVEAKKQDSEEVAPGMA